jgi:hypothetical protein
VVGSYVRRMSNNDDLHGERKQANTGEADGTAHAWGWLMKLVN